MTQRVLGPGGSPRRRRLWHVFVVLALAGIASVLVFAVGASAIGSSTFESADGNTVSNGGKDWESNAPNLAAANDAPTGQTDNAFGQGTAEGDVDVTVVTGSIPNSKADLGRFAVAGETIGNDSYIYLAWARENDSGSVNFDFEINQLAQPDLTTPGSKHLNRSNGDLLIGYSYQGNTLTPEINLRTWSASGWSDAVNLSTNGCADGQGNANQITENIFNLGSRVRAQGRFGEAGINLTCAGVVPSGTCNAFSSAYVKSRASQAITSEVKDFIAPVHLSLSNCGALKISKDSIKPNTPLQASFSITGPNNYSNTVQTSATDGTVCIAGLVPGSGYSITETAAPAGYKIDNPNAVAYTVVGNTDCSSAGLVTAAFTDTPLTDITVEAKTQATGGTQSSISCVKQGTTTHIGNSPEPDSGFTPNPKVEATGTTSGVAPGTYVCTVVVDP